VNEYRVHVMNTLIRQKWDGTSARVTGEEAASLLASVVYLPVEEVIKQELLADIDEEYRRAGWFVRWYPAKTVLESYWVFERAGE
jgi:hypothetical protein